MILLEPFNFFTAQISTYAYNEARYIAVHLQALKSAPLIQ